MNDGAVKRNEEVEWTTDYTARKLEDPVFDAFRRSSEHESWFNVLRAIVLFPLALLRFSTAMCFVTLCFVTFLLFGPDLANMGGEPLSYLPPWRQEIISRTGKLYARCALWCFGFYHIKGKEMPGYNAEEARKCTIIANHVSMVDILLFMSLFMPSFAAKASVRNIPLIGRIAAGMQCIFVERLTTKRGNATELVATRQRILSRGDDVPQLCIFPEGTTTNGNYLLPFKTGAFVAGEPVLPVLIRYPFRRFSPAYESIRTKVFLAILLTQFYNCVEYELHPVYHPSAAEKESPELYSKNVRSYIAKQGGYKLTDSLYIDKLEYHAILRNQPLPPKPKRD